MDDCVLDDDCNDETSDTGSDEPTEFSLDEPSDLPTDNCYGREQCFNSDADNNESLDSTSVDDETYSGPDCIATDCVGEPCEEGDSDNRSGSTFILTCVNGVWEGEMFIMMDILQNQTLQILQSVLYLVKSVMLKVNSLTMSTEPNTKVMGELA